MKIAIVAALDSELARLRKETEALWDVPCPGGSFAQGTIGPHDVALVLLSVGKVNAAAKTQAVIDRFQPDLIINTGIAGALAPEVQVLDTVIATEVGYHDFDPDLMERFSPFVRTFTPEPARVEAASHAASAQGMNVHKGGIATGDLFVSSDADKNRIREATRALCVEMEGCAVGHVAHLNGLPFLVLRTISDSADDNADFDYDTFEQQAADRSAGLLLELLLRHIP